MKVKPTISRNGLRCMASRSRVYKLLSQGFTYPNDELASSIGKGMFGTELTEAVRQLPVSYNLQEELDQILRSLRSVRGRGDNTLEHEYSLLFTHGDTASCPSYETEYGSSHIFAKAQDLADISGFYLAFGLQLSSAFKERPDNIGTELEFMHILISKEFYAESKGWKEKAATCRNAQRKFLNDHLGRWVWPFCTALQKASAADFYKALAGFTLRFIEYDCDHLSLQPVKLGVIQPQVPWTREFTCPMANECGIGVYG